MELGKGVSKRFETLCEVRNLVAFEAVWNWEEGVSKHFEMLCKVRNLMAFEAVWNWKKGVSKRFETLCKVCNLVAFEAVWDWKKVFLHVFQRSVRLVTWKLLKLFGTGKKGSSRYETLCKV